jgi:hypothetical protein
VFVGAALLGSTLLYGSAIPFRTAAFFSGRVASEFLLETLFTIGITLGSERNGSEQQARNGKI